MVNIIAANGAASVGVRRIRLHDVFLSISAQSLGCATHKMLRVEPNCIQLSTQLDLFRAPGLSGIANHLPQLDA